MEPDGGGTGSSKQIFVQLPEALALIQRLEVYAAVLKQRCSTYEVALTAAGDSDTVPERYLAAGLMSGYEAKVAGERVVFYIDRLVADARQTLQAITEADRIRALTPPSDQMPPMDVAPYGTAVIGYREFKYFKPEMHELLEFVLSREMLRFSPYSDGQDALNIFLGLLPGGIGDKIDFTVEWAGKILALRDALNNDKDTRAALARLNHILDQPGINSQYIRLNYGHQEPGGANDYYIRIDVWRDGAWVPAVSGRDGTPTMSKEDQQKFRSLIDALQKPLHHNQQ